MNCPHCPAAQLTMAERQGIEIDYCPQCRGGLRELFDFD